MQLSRLMKGCLNRRSIYNNILFVSVQIHKYASEKRMGYISIHALVLSTTFAGLAAFLQLEHALKASSLM